MKRLAALVILVGFALPGAASDPTRSRAIRPQPLRAELARPLPPIPLAAIVVPRGPFLSERIARVILAPDLAFAAWVVGRLRPEPPPVIRLR